MQNVQPRMENDYIKRKRQKKLWVKVMCGLACLVVFSTTYMLILPALTLEQKVYCGIEEHSHDSSCFEKRLVCTADEAAPHTHSESCYEQQRVLICEYENGENGHIHAAACYREEQVLTCTQKESVNHVHTEDCFETALTCGKEDHTHTLDCFSNPDADVESQESWEHLTSNLPLTGNPADDVVTVAKSQVGYEESALNYIISGDGTAKGYTRYGAWYGNTYGDWDAMFVAFCLHYAGVQDYPADADCSTWFSLLQSEPYKYFCGRAIYTPKAGDLIFFDNIGAGYADHVGIVESIDTETSSIRIIEGDILNCVQYRTLSIEDLTILGYGLLANDSKVEGTTSDESINAVPPAIALSNVADDFPYSNRYTKLGDGYPVANQWQITDQLYSTVKSGTGSYVYSQENGVRIQKAVIPSATENKFQVYLNAEPQMSWQEFFESCDHYATHNSASTFNPNSGYSKMYSKAEYEANGKPANWYPVYVNYRLSSTLTISLVRYVDFNELNRVNNGSYCFVNKKFATTVNGEGFGRKIQWKTLTNSGIALDIDCSNLYAKMTFAEDSVQPTQVIDPMGHNILFEDVQSYDGGGYVKPSEDNANVLTWNLPTVPYKNREYATVTRDGKETAYYTNVYEMRYDILLDVNADDFQSCAPVDSSPSAAIYPTNGRTILNYAIASNSKTVDFPIPKIRGLLYDITFDKQTDSGRSLSGAEFGLYQADGITPVYQADGTPYTITTVKGETTQFTDLPCGTYVLKEISPPPHYSAAETAVWTIQLSYTENSAVLAQNPLRQSNLRYTGNDRNGQWVIVNTRNEYTYQLKILKTDEYGKVFLQNASFSVTNPVDRTQVLDGTTDKNGCVTFNASFKPNIEYVLEETAAPDGYNLLPAAIRFVVKDDLETDTQTVELVNADELNELVQLNLSEEEGKATLTIQVVNQAGYELPETGGSGTFLFTLCGLGLMAGALMYRCHISRKRERRAEQS